MILTSLHADCIPVWLYDPVNHAAGLAHAGWRGTRADIAAAAAEEMCRKFGSRKEDILAFIGPGISRCCFETGPEVAEEFAELMGADLLYGSDGAYCIDDGNGKYHLDLKNINRWLLKRAGIVQIAATEYCTCWQPGISSIPTGEKKEIRDGCAPALCCFKTGNRKAETMEKRNGEKMKRLRYCDRRYQRIGQKYGCLKKRGKSSGNRIYRYRSHVPGRSI